MLHPHVLTIVDWSTLEKKEVYIRTRKSESLHIDSRSFVYQHMKLHNPFYEISLSWTILYQS